MAKQSSDTEEDGRISVLIVEDHEIMRFGLKKSLQRFEQVNVIGEAATGHEAVAKAQSLRPTVVIMDIGLPELNGIDATRLIKGQMPDTKVVMLTSFDDEKRTCAALAAGADAYCVKNIASDKLVAVLEKVRSGSGWLDPVIARHVVKIYSITTDASDKADLSTPVAVTDEDDEQLENLTERELQVLRFLMESRSEEEIALRLCVNENTVKSYVRKILKKLSTNQKTQTYLAHVQPGLA